MNLLELPVFKACDRFVWQKIVKALPAAEVYYFMFMFGTNASKSEQCVSYLVDEETDILPKT